MQGRDIREAIFTLQKKGHGVRSIARALSVSKNTVKRVLVSGQVEVPAIERTEKAEPHEEKIRALFALCMSIATKMERRSRRSDQLP